jgi:hypothetical protein
MANKTGSRATTKSKTIRERGTGANPGTSWPGRAGNVNITGYFDASVRSSLRLIQAQLPHVTMRELLAEALNLLFEKYNVPKAAPRRDSDL